MKRKNTGIPRPAISILPCNDTLTDMTKGEDKEETIIKDVPVNIKQGKDETGAHYPLPY
ncbi:MAG: hypothetical protein WA162_08925 [Thermodesulfobacteriota bacterium]